MHSSKKGLPRYFGTAVFFMRKRIYKVLFRIFMILIIGMGYALFYMRTGIGIPCPLRYFTGLKCPGCGVTRMCISLLQGNFAAAWRSRSVLFCLLPFFLFLLLWSSYCYIKTGYVHFPRAVNFLLYAVIIILVIFSIVRNISEQNFAKLLLHRFLFC